MSELNTDGMSLSQIRELAEAQEQAAAEPAEVVYTRTVTNPDGTESTYEGADMESLLDNVIAGRAAHQPAPTPAPPREPTADEEFVLAQEMASSPSKTFRKLVSSELGADVKDVKVRLAKLAEYEANAAAQDYVDQHPEYHAIPRNGKRIQDAMREANLPITLSNIEKTVAELDSKGLIEHKPPVFNPHTASLETLKAVANNQPQSEGVDW
jgi:hypothetical protein